MLAVSVSSIRHSLSLSLLIQLEPHRGNVRGHAAQPKRMSGSVMGQSVLVVRAGKHPVKNLLEPVRLTFRHNLSEVTPTGEAIHCLLSGYLPF